MVGRSQQVIVEVACLESAWALDHVEFARSLSRLDATWGSETFPLAGGSAVLCGAGETSALARRIGPTDLDPVDNDFVMRRVDNAADLAERCDGRCVDHRTWERLRTHSVSPWIQRVARQADVRTRGAMTALMLRNLPCGHAR